MARSVVPIQARFLPPTFGYFPPRRRVQGRPTRSATRNPKLEACRIRGNPALVEGRARTNLYRGCLEALPSTPSAKYAAILCRIILIIPNIVKRACPPLCNMLRIITSRDFPAIAFPYSIASTLMYWLPTCLGIVGFRHWVKHPEC